MNTKRRISNAVVVAALALAATLVMAALLYARGGAVFKPAGASLDSPATTVTLTGSYIGEIKLDRVVYSATLDTQVQPYTGNQPLPDLGKVDLGLMLQSSTLVTGYVDLANTLIFSPEHVISATTLSVAPGQLPVTVTVNLAVGPMLTGTFDGFNLRLDSEAVALNTGSGQHLTRKFRLVGTAPLGDTSVITGEYRETIWGYAIHPLTVLGTYTLQKPLEAVVVPYQRKVFVPMILR